mgnify:CR=1 FL=1
MAPLSSGKKKNEIDYATTVEEAYENLGSMVGNEGMKKLGINIDLEAGYVIAKSKKMIGKVKLEVVLNFLLLTSNLA